MGDACVISRTCWEASFEQCSENCVASPIIGLSGAIGAGKDALNERLVDEYPRGLEARNLHFKAGPDVVGTCVGGPAPGVHSRTAMWLWPRGARQPSRRRRSWAVAGANGHRRSLWGPWGSSGRRRVAGAHGDRRSRKGPSGDARRQAPFLPPNSGSPEASAANSHFKRAMWLMLLVTVMETPTWCETDDNFLTYMEPTKRCAIPGVPQREAPLGLSMSSGLGCLLRPIWGSNLGSELLLGPNTGANLGGLAGLVGPPWAPTH